MSRDESGRTAAIRRRLEEIDWPPIAIALVALVLLVWLGRDMTFYHDEWALILKRDLSINGILAPHNEHLSATLVVLMVVPASQAPYKASLLASRSLGLEMIFGSAEARARIPSSAMSEMIGFPSYA